MSSVVVELSSALPSVESGTNPSASGILLVSVKASGAIAAKVVEVRLAESATLVVLAEALLCVVGVAVEVGGPVVAAGVVVVVCGGLDTTSTWTAPKVTVALLGRLCPLRS